MDRLGVGWERLRVENPALVYCAITGYGQDGPLRDRAGHDLNYLARAGLLGLSGDADGPPVQSAGQIADVGGGALTAAFGILAALRSGQGQFVDISMADGALSWLSMLAPQRGASRGSLVLGGGILCYRPYRCADGYVALGALEPKFFAAFCNGVSRPELIEHQFDPPGSDAHADVAAIFLERTRAEWEAFNVRHDCCLEPVQDWPEALADPHFAARGMVLDGALGTPVKLSATPGDVTRSAPGPGEHTDEILAEAGLDGAAIGALREAGAIA
jgi:crotonobetainyl-CoA:carnitine CoA-transferase CaiB-like acyl-CoA transferase